VRTEESGTRTVTIRGVEEDEPRPSSASAWDDWGEMDPAAFDMPHERWVIEVTEDEVITVAGDMSAHSVWYGPTPGSRALSIGISLVEEHRGRGIGAVAQRLLAEELHDRDIVRVEACTDVGNVAEQRSLERAGFTLEGVLRGAQMRRDGRHDLQMWSHVREGA
jgi:RimJ/RimL family protein N-acetyltransferase